MTGAPAERRCGQREQLAPTASGSMADASGKAPSRRKWNVPRLFLPAFASKLHPYLALLMFLQLVCLCLPATAGSASPQEIVLTRGAASVRVDHGVQLLIEQPDEALTRDQVLAPALAGRWKLYPGKKINLSGETRPVWIRFSVLHEGAPGAVWLLGIDWPLLKQLDFNQYDPGVNRWVAGYRAGLYRPAHAELIRDPASVFPLAIEPGQRTTVVLRVRTDSLFTAPLVLWEEKEFHARRQDHAVLMGLLFGILGVMFFYNLSLFIFTRERSFLSYSVYLVTIVLYQLMVTGYGPHYLWSDTTWVKERGYEIFACASFLAATVFFRHFLNLGNSQAHLNRMNQVIMVFWTVCTAMALFPQTQLLENMVALGGIACGFAGIYTSVYLAVKGDVLARYFAIAWVTIIGATFFTLLTMFGAIEGGGWVEYAQQIGFVVETVLLSVALAERIKRERISKEAAQREALMLSRHVEQEREGKIRAQEHALAVQLQANEELELRVLDRTSELERAMENVELANIELARLSVTDALTKVHNRRYFDETFKKEHDRSARTGAPLALVLADVDHFKKINDSVGHLAGDECLRLVASALAHTVGRSTDLVARYGGEEFAIVLPATETSQALEVAERMRLAVQDIAFIYRGQRVPISISLGVAARVAVAGQPAADFVAQADKALYAAKRAGRNQVQLAAHEQARATVAGSHES